MGTEPTGRPAHRPRTLVDEQAIIAARKAGASMSALAVDFDVDRYVIRRVLAEAEQNSGQDATVLVFPHSSSPLAPVGQVTSLELLQRAGITYRQLDWWTRAGYLHTSTAAEPGSGSARFFPAAEIAVARLVARLVADGLTPAGAFRIARDLTEHGASSVAGIRIHLPEEH